MFMTKMNRTLWLFNLFSLVVLSITRTLAKTSDLNSNATWGLQLRMIHIDSPESPVYDSKLTDFERSLRMIEMSQYRMRDLANTTIEKRTSRYGLKSLTPEMGVQGLMYHVEMGLGQFDDTENPYHKIYLVFDTGSDLVWTKCEGGTGSSQDGTSLYPKSRSHTYQPFPCMECQDGQCNQDHCTIQRVYNDGTIMMGILAKETFTFISQYSVDETINGLTFSCAMQVINFKAAFLNQNVITGILGMNRKRTSFVMQLGSRGGYRFSYCLQDHRRWDGSSSMFLKFGGYITTPSIMSVTPLLTPRQVNYRQYYYVNLVDISVDGRRLHIPQNLFEMQRDSSGGTMFDSGTSISHIVPGAFNILKDAIMDYVINHNHGLTWYDQDTYAFEACWEPLYDSPPVFFPTITFHLQDADMLIQPTEVISEFPFLNVPQPGLYCMALLRSTTKLNVIGSFQQINQWVMINHRTSKLSFAPADCSLNTY